MTRMANLVPCPNCANYRYGSCTICLYFKQRLVPIEVAAAYRLAGRDAAVRLTQHIVYET